MSSKQWIQWSPKWAPHVKGRYTKRERDPANGMCEPQHVHMVCAHRGEGGKLCGASWQTICASGQVRNHINRFAKQHTHTDFAQPARIVRPGSKRSTILEKNNAGN